MFSIDTLEQLLEDFSSDNYSSVKRLLQEESARAKKSGRIKVSQRIDNLISRLSKTKSAKGGVTAGTSYSIPVSFDTHKLVQHLKPQFTLEEMVLNESQKDIIRTLVREWSKADELKSHSLSPVNKIVLYGPPGTGKNNVSSCYCRSIAFTFGFSSLG